MTTRTRSHIYLSMAAMILTAALAVPAAAQNSGSPASRVPSKEGRRHTARHSSHNRHGNWHPSGSILIDPGSYGKHSHRVGSLGRGQWRQHLYDIRRTGGTGPVVFKVTEIHTITGGTGRFTGAQGSFTVDRLHAGRQ